MLKTLLLALLSLAVLPTLYGGTVVGSLQGPSGLPVKAATLNFQLNQAGLMVGTGAVVPITASCYTDALGNVVGLPNMQAAPTAAVNLGSGSLPGGIYYVTTTWLDGSGGETAPSPELRIQLSSTGSLQIAVPTSVPAGAVNINVYAGTVKGNETLQGTQSLTAPFILSSLSAGAAQPTSNSTICRITFNDQVIPYTGYTVSLISSSGNAYPGYPQSWQLNGGQSGLVNISQGAPLWNGVVVYPMPILSQPLNHGPQSISGPLTLYEDPTTGLQAATKNYADSVLTQANSYPIIVGGVTRAVEYKSTAGVIERFDLYPDTAVTDYADGSVVGTAEWAINQLGTNGGEVFMMPGYYPTLQSLVIDWDWITLQGANHTHWDSWRGGFPTHALPGTPGGAQIDCPAALACITIGTTVANMHGDTRHKGEAFRDLYLYGKNAATYGIFDPVETDLSEIKSVTFQGFQTAAIDVGWDYHQIIFNNIQDNNGSGIIDSGLYPTIIGNITYDLGGTGIAITGGRQAMITSNAIGSVANCIVLTGGSSTVFGNTFNAGCNGVTNTGGVNLVYGNYGAASPFFDTNTTYSLGNPMVIQGPVNYGQAQVINPTPGLEASILYNDAINTGVAAPLGAWVCGKNISSVPGWECTHSATSTFATTDIKFKSEDSGNFDIPAAFQGASLGLGTFNGTSYTPRVGWTFGAGAPSGSCLNGSFYSNTSGGTGSTIYGCVSSAWVNIK